MPEEFVDSQFLISVDHEAQIFIDKKLAGIVKVDEFVTFIVFPGEHYLEALSLDSAWKWKEKVVVESGSQKIVEIKMIPTDASIGSLGEFIDPRDNNKYKTVTIKGITWMADNLRYKTPNSFDINDDPNNAMAFGKLYLYDEATYACPKDWHIPSNKEWEDLTQLYIPDVASDLRPNGKSNFNLTFAGHCVHDLTRSFRQTNASCNYWTNKPKTSLGGRMKEYHADTMYIDADDYKISPFVCNIYNRPWGFFASIRCIKN